MATLLIFTLLGKGLSVSSGFFHTGEMVNSLWFHGEMKQHKVFTSKSVNHDRASVGFLF